MQRAAAQDRRRSGAVVALEVAIPAAIGLAAGAGGALVAGVGRSEASTQTAPASGSRVAAIAGGAFEGARAGASAFPAARNLGRAQRGRCGRAWGRNVGPGPWRSGRRVRRREVHVGRRRGRWQFVRPSARHQNAQQHAARGPAATHQPQTASRAAASSAADGV